MESVQLAGEGTVWVLELSLGSGAARIDERVRAIESIAAGQKLHRITI